MSEIENFLAQAAQDGQAWEGMGEAPAESQPAEPEKVEEPPQGGEEAKADNTPVEKKLDFHEHPRFKELIEEKNALKAQIDELSKLKADVDSWKASSTTVQVPQWFQSMYGDSPDAWNLYQQHNQEERQKMKAEILQEFESKKAQEVEEQQRWDKWVDSSLDSLKAQGATFERNKLIKIATEYQPTDEDGNISLKKAYEIYKIMEGTNEKAEARKQLGASVTQSSNSEPPKKDYVTPADLRKRNWRNL